jgi:hypothetical protein
MQKQAIGSLSTEKAHWLDVHKFLIGWSLSIKVQTQVNTHFFLYSTEQQQHPHQPTTNGSR